MMLQEELILRRNKIRALMAQQNIDAALICTNVNLLYACGEIFTGYFYLSQEHALLFVKRPNNLKGDDIYSIRKPAEILSLLNTLGIELPKCMMIEGDGLTFNEYNRLIKCFPNIEIVPSATKIVREARTIKTPYEIELFKKTGMAHARAYAHILQLFKEGMTDLQLSIEIERAMRLEGNLGIFRIFGQSMEIFMGSLLAGDNGAAPSPYDFALGGKGLDASLPVGACGRRINKGESVMVDMGGNFFGYMGDMTRVYSYGKLSDDAYDAHKVCIEIQNRIAEAAKPGVTGEALYNIAMDTVHQSKWSDCFMGVGQKAGFVGHGVGLEINESPVLAPRMQQELAPGMVFALEPKIIVTGVGPVGVENTWTVTEKGVEKLTLCPEEIVELG